MSEPRIPLLSIEESKQAAAKMEVPEAIAELSVFRILLRQPKLAKRVNDLLMTLLIGGALDARLRELIIMRIGWSTGSVYEWTQHWRVALQLGVDEADLLAVRDWTERSHWSDADRVILRATDETLESGAVTAETWAECARHLPSHEEQLELVGAIGTWRMISQILKSLEVPLEDGVAPWPPDGLAPAAGGD
ncbi:MAG: carboxymuconolactone decarboxylase family protein [Myxococcota bacterium]|jgi:alkylhydroperoxidase family enzyme|nr:carboxymuconolactone decarboxylase family protein [Myxococcota bacterium]